MNNYYKNKQRGIIKMIILIIITIAILSWYGVDIKNFFTSPLVKKNFSYIWNFISDIWNNYIGVFLHKVWQIWLDYVWGPLSGIIEKGSDTTNGAGSTNITI